MGHEMITGKSLAGTSRDALDKLMHDLAREHQEEEGSSHSVRLWDTHVTPGVTTPTAFYRRLEEDGGTLPRAQMIVAPKDLIKKTFKVTLPVKTLAQATSWEELTAAAAKACAAKGLQLVSWKYRHQEGELSPGVTGKVRVKNTTPQAKPSAPRTVTWQLRDEMGRSRGEFPTRAEAVAAATTAALPAFHTSAAPVLTLHRVVTPTGTEAKAVLTMMLTGGKVHLEVEGEKMKANAPASGWVVALDCHH